MIPKHWKGINDGEEWAVTVEHDCFALGDPFVVSVLVVDESGETLAPLPPGDAREMAAALLYYADAADEANERVAHRPMDFDQRRGATTWL